MLDVILEQGRDRSVRRRHPWVLSGAVARVDHGPGEPGDWARVRSSEGEVLAYGHFSPFSQLRVRLLSFHKEASDEGLLEERIAAAVKRREATRLVRDTNAVRLVNAEGDGLPGLVADLYGDVVIVKLTSAGMAVRRDRVARALQEATGALSGFERADTSGARREGIPARQGVLWGDEPGKLVHVHEGDRRYAVDVVSGQKTGFYLDQRDARDVVQQVAAGRHALDLFGYTGGFSVAAARGGAASVRLVETSWSALSVARRNLAENAPDIPTAVEQFDAFRFLRQEGEEYGLIVIDPPPLARSRKDVERASRAYKDALLFALRHASPGALIFFFACSFHVGPELFRKIAFGACHDAGRSTRILRTFGQPADHPIAIEHPEGAYLTGLLLEA